MQKTSSSMNSTALGRPPISTFNKLARWLTSPQLCKISDPLFLSLRKIQLQIHFCLVLHILYFVFCRASQGALTLKNIQINKPLAHLRSYPKVKRKFPIPPKIHSEAKWTGLVEVQNSP